MAALAGKPDPRPWPAGITADDLLDRLEEVDLTERLIRSKMSDHDLAVWARHYLDFARAEPESRHNLYRGRAHVKALMERLAVEQVAATPSRPAGLLARVREYAKAMKGVSNKW